ncbi:hypothetical protein SCHPADRAFT_290012 [Schizopora paradoxa]|uniref:Uncharacterized protein n=1 Tax=Schizopora paradoxa TaxID=27342 RepID=A0A0H2RZD9_9AGAM|nr:hypothetical protein SCHPADRAFT_290012 [Schizopora paradoxa]
MTRSSLRTANNTDDLAVAVSHQRARTSSSSITTLDPSKAADRRFKARERQRRKRERDKQNNGRIGAATFRANPVVALLPETSIVAAPLPPPPQPPPSLPETTVASTSSANASTSAGTPSRSLRRVNDDANMTEEEITRRNRIREAAKLRQRKHRDLVKQRKLVELGLAMNPDGLGGLEEMHYALGPDGSYQPVLPPPPPQQQPLLPDHQAHHHQATFPTGHTGGSTFASTLLLSFSCSPLLKQHLLRTLHMTNEELASLEPVLAAAWDQWDHARRMHYAEQAAKVNLQQQQQQNGVASGSGSTSGSPSTASQAGPSNGHVTTTAPPPFVLPHPPPGLDTTSLGNDYRARFHRPLTAPSLFSTAGQDGSVMSGSGTNTGSSTFGTNGVQESAQHIY